MAGELAELFQKDTRTVSEHIGNIFEEAELQPDSVVRNFRITAADGFAELQAVTRKPMTMYGG